MKKLLILIAITTTMLFSSKLLEVELEPHTIKDHPLQIAMTLTNISNYDIYIDKENFPFTGSTINRDMFKIKEDGENILYNGIKSRGEPEYKLLTAGESHTIYISLSNFYLLHQGTHQYDIVYTDTISIKYKNISKLVILTSNHIELEATTKKRKSSKYKKSRSIKSTCTPNQRTILANDISRAKSAALKAIQRFPVSGYNDPLYKKYFGPANSTYLNAVYENYKRIYSATQQVNITCERQCRTRTVKAYVHSNEYRNKVIYVCPAYWPKSPNQRHGILIHELSHFYDTANTDDYLYPGYGTSHQAASELAKHTPHQAIRGAYNYGYYAEEILTQDTGSSQSNRWTTGTYSNNQNIRKTLKISKGHRITVRIDGEIEAGHDFINIYNSKGQFLRQFSGVIHTSFTVKGKGIIAHLVTNSSVVKHGVTISIKRKKYWWELLCFWC